MAKIYNEIVIDMNPESPTFEETLFEDSFEYSGDMYLAQSSYAEEWMTEMQTGGEQISANGKFYKWMSGRTPPGYMEISPTVLGQYGGAGGFTDQIDLKVGTGDSWVDPITIPVGEREDIGVPSLTEADWMGKSLEQQAQYILDTKYGADGDYTTSIDVNNTPDKPNDDVTLESLMKNLEQQPLKGEIDPTKAGFLAAQYGGAGTSFADSLAGRAAGQTLEGNIYSLQDTAYQVGSPTTGRDLRGRISGQQKIKKGFDTSYGGYGLAGDTAASAYSEGMYGLEEGVESDWESNWSSWWNTLPSATGT